MNRNASSVQKAAAITDLFRHMTYDLPLAFSDCGHMSTDVKQMIEMTKKYVEAFSNFRTMIHILFDGHM